mgnify:CR=1 FL=1
MRYESQTDRNNETAVIASYASMRGLNAIKMPERYFGDYALCEERGYILEYVEVKCRNIGRLDFDTINISLLKCLRMLDLAEASRVPFTLLYRFKDGGLYKREVTRDDMGKVMQMWGRKNVRDDQEIEPCVLIPSDEFVSIDE